MVNPITKPDLRCSICAPPFVKPVFRSACGGEFEYRRFFFSPGSGGFGLFSRDFEQILGQVVSLKVKTLSNTNLVASRRVKREKGSLPVDVPRSKASVLKLPNVVLLTLLNLRGAHNSE